MNLAMSGEHSASALNKIKVVSLNFWGITYVSKDVQVRLQHLITALKETDYDIVSLQEIWSMNDYDKLRNSLVKHYPYSYYFKSGLNGSGCCLFSKHQIENVFQYRYSLNGYSYKILHGDWFGGKLAGLAVINFNRLKLNVYITHIHANYSQDFLKNIRTDEYLAHRLTQLYELSEFIAHTSQTAELCLLMGDLNTCDWESGYKMLTLNARLADAYFHNPNTINGKNQTSECSDATCHAKNNKYSANPAFPDGLRIDYIMYKPRNDIDVKCLKYEKCLGKIESTNLHYSDHEGIMAEFQIQSKSGDKSNNVRNEEENQNELVQTYHEMKSILSEKHNSISNSIFAALFLAIVCLIGLFFVNNIHEYLTLFKNCLLTFLTVTSLMFIVFIKLGEKRMLNAFICNLNVKLDSLSNKKTK